jgi:1-acyl-sn-glycerol-3-phosphate acyltransferase
VLRWLGGYFNFVFIDRYNPDVKALRRIISLMEAGNNLVIAPEGTRSRVGSMIEGRLGVSYLAARLNRPILPVAIAGTDDALVFANLRRLHRSPIVLRAGPTFQLPPLPKRDREAALRQYTDEIMCRIATMLPPRYRGVYAEHPRLKELLGEADTTDVQRSAV